jgi:hypothetical protein
MLNASAIRDSQGYIKDLDDIRTILQYVHVPYISRKHLKNPRDFKRANKFLTSLNHYYYRLGLIDYYNVNYQNVDQKYTFLDDFKKLKPFDYGDSIRKLVTLSVGDDYTGASYKPAKIDLGDDDDDYRKRFSKKTKRKLRGVAATFSGKKHVDKDLKFLFKLKDAPDDKDKRFESYYEIYLNWYQSKIRSHEKHAQFFNAMSNALCLHKETSSKAFKRYYLDKDLFFKFVKRELVCPKRFLKIVKFVQHIEKKKFIRNDSLIDKMAQLSTVIKVDKKDTNLVVGELSHYRLKGNLKTVFWIRRLVWDAVRKGYLEEKERGNDFPYNVTASLKVDRVDYPIKISEKEIFKHFPKVRRLSDDIKKLIIKYCDSRMNLKDDDYFIFEKRLKRGLKVIFNTEEFRRELYDHVSKKKASLTNPVSLLDAFIGDTLVGKYLKREDFWSLEKCKIDSREDTKLFMKIGYKEEEAKGVTNLILKYSQPDRYKFHVKILTEAIIEARIKAKMFRGALSPKVDRDIRENIFRSKIHNDVKKYLNICSKHKEKGIVEILYKYDQEPDRIEEVLSILSRISF